MAPAGGEPREIISGVSIDDYKKLEASMEDQTKEMHDMMTQLLANKLLASPLLEDTTSATQNVVGDGILKEPPPKIVDGKEV